MIYIRSQTTDSSEVALMVAKINLPAVYKFPLMIAILSYSYYPAGFEKAYFKVHYMRDVTEHLSRVMDGLDMFYIPVKILPIF